MSFNDTTDCPNCGDENAYFNGFKYECPDCGYEWNNDEYLDESLYLNEQEEMVKEFIRREKQFVWDKIDRNALKRLFCTDWKFYKSNELYREDGLEENYGYLVAETIATTNNYKEVIKIKYSDLLEIETKNIIMKNTIAWYLESRDDLPLFPKIDDWVKYINAPKSFIQEIIPKGHIDYKKFMPLSDYGYNDFTILFHKKIQKIFTDEKSLSRESSLEMFENAFTCLANNDKFDCFGTIGMIITDILKKSFKKELELIKKYYDDLRSKNGFDKYITTAKDGNFSLIETILFIFEDYFKEIIE